MSFTRAAALAAVALVAVASLAAPPSVVGQPTHWESYRRSGPLFWMPKSHLNWPRQASLWLPNDGCGPDPYETVVKDIHNQSCGEWNYLIWQHRDARSDAEEEFGKATSFEHDLDPVTVLDWEPWHYKVSGAPESQRCQPPHKNINYHEGGRFYQSGWGGFQNQQHIGEWYQGRQYLPDFQEGRVRPKPGAAPLSPGLLSQNVDRFGFFDFDIYSRPPLGDRVPHGGGGIPRWGYQFDQTGESCAAVALYEQFASGMGGRSADDPAYCMAEATSLRMVTNTELRCEPDLSLWRTPEWGDHPYAHDFRDLLLRHQDPMVYPTRATEWWPPPEPGQPLSWFVYKGVRYNTRAFLSGVGLAPPFQPQFPHNWDDECTEEPSVLGCGPGQTEAERRSGDRARYFGHPDADRSRLIFGSRPLYRRFEVSIQMPGEQRTDLHPRSMPEEWTGEFDGYRTTDSMLTPNTERAVRQDQLSVDPAVDFGSAEWIGEFLADDAGELAYRGSEVSNPLEYEEWMSTTDDPGAVVPASFRVSDCLRFLPTEEPIADRAGGDTVDEFWNATEWRDCAREAFAGDRQRLRIRNGAVTPDGVIPEGGTARDQSGTMAINTWLRHQGDDSDVTRVESSAATNLDPDGWTLDLSGTVVGSEMGMPEVPPRNQASLMRHLGGDPTGHTWYRTAGTQIGCLWGGYIPADLVGAAASMEAKALAEVEKRLYELAEIVLSIGTEASEAASPDFATCDGPGTRNHRIEYHECAGEGSRNITRHWEQEILGQTCICTNGSFNTFGSSPTRVVDCPTSREPNQQSGSRAIPYMGGFELTINVHPPCPSIAESTTTSGSPSARNCTVRTVGWDPRSASGTVADDSCRTDPDPPDPDPPDPDPPDPDPPDPDPPDPDPPGPGPPGPGPPGSCTPSTSDWSNALQSCGTRTVRTCNGTIAVDTIETVPCPTQCQPTDWTWTAWSNVGDSCGIRNGTRTVCTSGSPEVESRQEVDDCPMCVPEPVTFGDWGAWSNEALSCGTRIRPGSGLNCVNNVGVPVTSVDTETKICEWCTPVAVVWDPWGPWSDSVNSCGTRSRTGSGTQCVFGVASPLTQTETDTDPCEPCVPGPWSDFSVWSGWSPWSNAVDQCGTRTRTRSRSRSECPSGVDTDTEREYNTMDCQDLESFEEECTCWETGGDNSRCNPLFTDECDNITCNTAAGPGTVLPIGRKPAGCDSSTQQPVFPGAASDGSSPRARAWQSVRGRAGDPFAGFAERSRRARAARPDASSRAGGSASAAAPAGSATAAPRDRGGADSLLPGVQRARSAAGTAAAAGPASGDDLRSGFRAMRDGILLAQVTALNNAQRAFDDPAGTAADAPPTVGGVVEHSVLERSTSRAALPAMVRSALAAPSAARAGVFAAAARGGDVAAGGWFGWTVGGTDCYTGMNCAQELVVALDQASNSVFDYLGDASLTCDTNVGALGPHCLYQLYWERNKTAAELQLWAETYQGWIAVGEYRANVLAQLPAMSPYEDWSGFNGVMPDIATSSYVTAEVGITPVNPMCVIPPQNNPLPARTIEREDDTIAYSSDNDADTPSIWDMAGVSRVTPSTDSDFAWPPTDALKDIPVGAPDWTMAPEQARMVRSCGGSDPAGICAGDVPVACADFAAGSEPAGCSVPGTTHVDVAVSHYRRLVPGLYTGNERGSFREVFYGEPGGGPFRPDMYDYYGMGTTENMTGPGQVFEQIAADGRDLPRVMRADDHLAGFGATSSVIFRELSCPAIDVPGNYATVRPVVCHRDWGTAGRPPLQVHWGWFLEDHMTPCTSGEEDCAERIFSEPVYSTGGRGMDPTMSTEPVVDQEGLSIAERFGSDYMHLCTPAGTGPPAVGDGRYDVDGTTWHMTHANYDDPPSWLSGGGVGTSPLPHGHDPAEGYFPARREYPDQNGVMRVFDPFAAAYDNYGEVYSAGDVGPDGLLFLETDEAGGVLTDGDGLFGDHAVESRVLDSKGRLRYDEFVTTAYQVRQRMASFRLWNEVRQGPPNSVNANLLYGWPTLDDLQDVTGFLKEERRRQNMRDRRLTTQQQLFGVAPEAQRAEQIWLRNDGPMAFFGGTRVANNDLEGGRGGCLLEVNPPADALPPGMGITRPTAFAVRPVLSNIHQAWCVMAHSVRPIDSCITLP